MKSAENIIKEIKLAAVVVLYNPEHEIIDNICSYIDQVEKLYIVDNSEIPNQNLIIQLGNIKNAEYISNKENLGIAKALNIGAFKAIKDQYEWLLTIDQDSKPQTDMINNMLDFIEKNDIENIGIISPIQIIQANQNIKYSTLSEEKDLVMTSGNILNLKIFETVNGFLDYLFIDQVDHEYCLRIKNYGYKIIQINNAFLDHQLGERKKIKILFFSKERNQHSPLRIYYIFRNGLYVNKKYKKLFPEFNKYIKNVFRNEIICTFLVSEDRIKKFKFIIQAYFDYKNNIFGKYLEK